MPEVSAGDLEEGVAFLHGHRCGGRGGGRGGEKDLRASFDVVGVVDVRVNGEQVMPAESLTEILLGEFPERVAGLHGDHV